MRYTSDQLREMAQTVVAAERAGDRRAIVLYIAVCGRTGMQPADVRARIHSMAGETDVYA